MPARSDVAADVAVPAPPFLGERVVKGIQLADYAAFLDERATFLGQWGLKPTRGAGGRSYEELVETEGRPRLRSGWTGSRPRGWSRPASCTATSRRSARATTWWCWTPAGAERERFSFPRQRHDRHLCLADFFRSRDSGETDVVGFQLVTVGVTAQRGDGRAVRQERLPRLPGAARAVGAAHRGAGRVLAPAGPRRARLRRRRPGRPRRPAEGQVPGLPVRVRLPGLPDLEDRAKVVRLLSPERIGVTLSEEFQLHPEQSTDALIVHHPEAKYFSA